MAEHFPEWEQKQAELELAEKAGEAVADGVVTGYRAIENGVVTGYHKIEDGVVSGYRKIEDGVVSGYRKIEDKFVDAFLKKDGESLEDARARLAAQTHGAKAGEGEAKP